MALKQFGKYVILRPVPVATQTPAGLSLPDKGEYEQGVGIVVNNTPGVSSSLGKGTKVYFDKQGGAIEVRHGKEDFFAVLERDIVAFDNGEAV